MNKKIIIGIFSFVDDIVEAIERLKEAGFREMATYSPIPCHDIEHALPEDEEAPLLSRIKNRNIHVVRFTAVGAFFGIGLALFIGAGTALFWPIQTGGMPILALPPIGLISYELMSLGAAVFSIAGFFFLSRMPTLKLKEYVPQVSDDKFSLVLHEYEEEKISQIKTILEQSRCDEIEERIEHWEPLSAERKLSRLRKAGAVLAILTFVVTIVYGSAWIWVKSSGFYEQNQFSYKPQEWQEKDTKIDAIPVNYSSTSVPTRDVARKLRNPVPLTSDSLVAGKKTFNTFCAVCHGEKGDGVGLMGSVPSLAPIPAEEKTELEAYLREFIVYPLGIELGFVGTSLTDGEIFYTVTNGGEAIMPSFKDALTPTQRWQLVNFVRWRFANNIGK